MDGPGNLAVTLLLGCLAPANGRARAELDVMGSEALELGCCKLLQLFGTPSLFCLEGGLVLGSKTGIWCVGEKPGWPAAWLLESWRGRFIPEGRPAMGTVL